MFAMFSTLFSWLYLTETPSIRIKTKHKINKYTLSNKKTPNIWRPAVRVKQYFFLQKFNKIHLGPFASKSINYSSRTGRKAQLKALFWIFWSKIDGKQEISRIFKDSLWLEQLTDFDGKATK